MIFALLISHEYVSREEHCSILWRRKRKHVRDYDRESKRQIHFRFSQTDIDKLMATGKKLYTTKDIQGACDIFGDICAKL